MESDQSESMDVQAELQRILIIKPSSLGDVATTLPVLCDLKRIYPQAEIDWLVQPEYAAVLEGHDALHEIILFDRRKLASWWWKPSAFRLFWGLMRKLRQRRYDLIIDAQGLFRSGFLARITGAQVRVGFANAREFAPAFYTHKVQLPEGGRKMVAVDRMRALLGPLGIDTGRPAEFRVPTDASVVSRLGLEAGYVVVIPGARWDTKRWHEERYVETIRRLRDAGRPVVLLGSPDEKALCDRIASAVGAERLKNLGGRTTIREMIGVLAGAMLVVGNDSGPLHIAVALGRPVVAIYGPTSERFVGPYGQLANVLRHDVSCHPCRLHTCDHHSCMKGVTVELVWEKIAATPAGEASSAKPQSAARQAS